MAEKNTSNTLLALVVVLLLVVGFLMLERFEIVSLSSEATHETVYADGSNRLIGGTERPDPRQPVEDLGLHEVVTALPETAAGTQLTWALDTLNVYREGLDEAAITEHFAPSAFEEIDAPELTEEFTRLARGAAPYAFVGFVTPPTETSIVGMVSVSNNRYQVVTLNVEAEAPNRIVDLVFRAYF